MDKTSKFGGTKFQLTSGNWDFTLGPVEARNGKEAASHPAPR